MDILYRIVDESNLWEAEVYADREEVYEMEDELRAWEAAEAEAHGYAAGSRVGHPSAEVQSPLSPGR